MFKNRNLLAVIPARTGSKGILKKNFKKIKNKTLIRLCGELCKKLSQIDLAVISTDSTKFADEGRRCGLKFLFKRPKKLANDSANAESVWRHAWSKTEFITKKSYDISLYLEPTSPCRKASDCKKVLNGLLNSNSIIAFTVSKVPLKYSAHRQIGSKNNIGKALIKKSKTFCTRQSIPETFIKNGVCYAAKRSFLNQKRRIIDCKPLIITINRKCVNIDSPADLTEARKILR